MAPRRNRLLFALVLLIVVGILYLTSSSRAVSTHDFYARTRSRLETDSGTTSGSSSGSSGSSLDKITPQRKTSGSGGGDDEVAEAMGRRLMDAEVAAKEMANKKAPTRESVMGDDGGAAGDKDRGKEGKSGGGQKVVTAPKDIVKDGGKGGKDRNVAGRKKYPIAAEEGKVVKEEKKREKQNPDDSEEAVTAEMNSILKMSPSSSPLPQRSPSQRKENPLLTTQPTTTVIIFSKSYCGFSRKAKSILLTKYVITPTPYVVELDKHPLGPALQARLATMTGRKTVPNVLVKGKSIGGGDDVVALDEMGELGEKVGGLGGKGVSVKLREVEAEV
jgi:glutaredoxin